MIKEVHLFSLKSLFWDIKIHVEFHSTFHWLIGYFEFRTEISCVQNLPMSKNKLLCLGRPENQTSSRNYNLFVWSTVFQLKYYDIQKTWKIVKIQWKVTVFLIIFRVCSILARKQRPKPIRWPKVDHTASFDTHVVPRGGIIVEISWF